MRGTETPAARATAAFRATVFRTAALPAATLRAVALPAATLRKAALPAAALLAAALLAPGCGSGDRAPEPRFGTGERDYRARAERYENDGDTMAALQAYRDAARRFPTRAWPWSGAGRAAERLGRFREATEALASALRWDSTLVEDRTLLADLALEHGRSEEALARIDAAIRHGGEDPERLALRGRALTELGRPAEARSAIERGLAVAPDDPALLVALAFARFRADSVPEAVATFDALVRERPGDVRAHAARGAFRREVGDRDGARQDLQRAVELEPAFARCRLTLARWKLEDGDPEAARADFRRLLESNPSHPAALAGLGACALAAGDPDEAERALTEATESDPEFAPAYLDLGRLRRGQGRLDEAVALLRKARARAGREPRLHERCSAELAEAYLDLGESQNAMEVADALLARDEGSELGRALRGRALAAGAKGAESGTALERIATRPQATREEVLAYVGWLLDHGEAQRARELADGILAERPHDADARAAHAEALAALGEHDAAERELHDLLAAGDGGARAHLALARLYLSAGRLPDAVHHSIEGERLDPGNPDFPVIRGRASLQEGRLGEARAAFERERDLRPESPRPWMNLGDLELEQGDAEAAAECFARAGELDPASWLAPHRQGLALARAGRPREAVEAYRAALTRNERVAEAHNNLAWLLADLDLDPVLAVVHARRAADLAPDNANVLGTLGWAQHKAGRGDEAAASLRRACGLAPDDAMKRYLLGVVEADGGDPESARRDLREALRLDPGFGRAESARRLLETLED
jgi:tetratricopeptide (TPR) repeat protein